MNHWFSQILLLTFSTRSSFTTGGRLLRSSLCMSVRPSFNCSIYRTPPSLMTLGPQTPNNWRRSSAAVRFFAFKNRITARISQLVGFSIKMFILKRHKMTQQQDVETEISGFKVNYLSSMCMRTPNHVTTMASVPQLLTF